MKTEKLLVEAQLYCKLSEISSPTLLSKKWRRAVVLLTDERIIVVANTLCYSFDHSCMVRARLLRPTGGGSLRLLQLLYVYGPHQYTLSLKGPRSILLLLQGYLRKMCPNNFDKLYLKLVSLLRSGVTDTRAISYILDQDEREIERRIDEVYSFLKLKGRFEGGSSYE